MIRGPQQKMYLSILCGILGVVAFFWGLRPLLAGDYSYNNWFGGLVFAPVAIIAGGLMVLGAVFNWRSIWDVPRRDTKHRPASARLLAVLPLLILLSAPLHAQTTAKATERKTAARPPKYPDSADGLKLFLQDVLAAAKPAGNPKLAAFVEDMEIPDYAEWFPKTFGKGMGDSWSESYGDALDFLGVQLQGLFIRLAQQNLEIVTRKINDAPQSDAERRVLQLFQQPVDVFFGGSKPRPGAGGQPASAPDALITPLGYFWFIDGKFRWDPTNPIGRFSIAMPVSGGSSSPGADSSASASDSGPTPLPPTQSQAQSTPPCSDVHPILKRGTQPALPPCPDPPPDASPPEDSVSTRSLSPAEALIERAREAAFEFSEKLPNFICEEFMSRFTQRGREKEMPLDVVSAEIIYEDTQESYRNVKINNRPTDKGLQEIGGSWSTGEFASTLVELFHPNTDAQFRSGGASPISGFSAQVYDFQVRRENSHWMVHSGSQTLVAAYGGSVWVDPKTARVLRIEIQARNISPDFPMDTVESAVDYSYVMIGGRSFLLPVHAESLGCERGTSHCSHNIIDFRNYHEFKSEIKILP